HTTVKMKIGKSEKLFNQQRLQNITLHISFRI
uniref:Uncharacterized protein n=1 Tax=Amphimedon queenslandica TaxID=400682 RepID=A0A1X7UQG9_AMPQE